MYLHPNSIGCNVLDEMPEIFTDNNVDFMHFCMALNIYKGGRTIDYFDSTTFLFGSKETKDINMLFSAVQRCFGYEHKDFQAYISSEPIRNRLLDICGDKDRLKQVIEDISNEYNNKYGMNRQINGFYEKHLCEESRKILLSRIIVPASYYANSIQGRDFDIKKRIDFLLNFRNKFDHSAEYHQLSPDGKRFEHVKVMKGKKEYTFLVKLTFTELYEITRQAMADFWLKEYKDSLSDGRKARVDKIVEKTKEENRKINEERKKAGL